MSIGCDGVQVVYRGLRARVRQRPCFARIATARRLLYVPVPSMKTISIEDLKNVNGGAGGAIMQGIGGLAGGVGGLLGGVGGLMGGIGQLKVAKAQAEQIKLQTAMMRSGQAPGGAPQGGEQQAA
jgi:bacteriocin-like protein